MVTIGSQAFGMWLEDPGALSSGNSRTLMFFVGLVAFCMLIQAIVVVVFSLGAMKMNKRLIVIAEELHGRAMPIIDRTGEILDETMPKVRVITDNLVETSAIVRSKAQEFDATLNDANSKTRAQVAKVDGMVSTALARTASLGELIHDGIRVPVKQVAGVIAGFRVGLEVLLSKANNMRGPRGF